MTNKTRPTFSEELVKNACAAVLLIFTVLLFTGALSALVGH